MKGASPQAAHRQHLALLIGWVMLIPPSIIWWRESIVWVVFMSHYACIVGHWGGLEAARVEVRQDEDD
jgi:hypothetical protein